MSRELDCPRPIDIFHPQSEALSKVSGLACLTRSLDQPLQPILMPVDHRIGPGQRQFCGRLTLLGFLGEDAHTTARQILDQPGMVHINIEQMLQPQAFDPATAQMIVSMASTDYALRAVVVPFLSALRLQAPNIRVAVQPVDVQHLAGQLDRGDIDLALVTPDSTAPGLHAAALFDERYVCVMRAGHPDAAAKTWSLERFCSLDHVLVSPSGGSFQGVTDQALARIGRSRRVTLSVTSFLVLPEILRTSDLIAVVPRRLALHADGLVMLEPPVEVPGFSKTLAWHERTHHDPGQQWLRTLLIDTCRRLD